MVKAQKYIVVNNFVGYPKREDYVIVQQELPELKSGEILVKTEWISVDPYLRAYNGMKPIPYEQFSYQIGIVIESKDPEYPVDTRVVTHKGWCDHFIFNTKAVPKDVTEKIYKLPDFKGLSNSLGVGLIGMPGVTAYFGFLEICQPKAGETVVVTGAAGAVGSIVGQLAKLKGCKVIGFAGSDAKVEWLKNELEFDTAYNYKTADIIASLKESAPNGVDCYFDNVGGEISSAIITQMNLYGRVSVCGSISYYNEDIMMMPSATILQPSLILKQIKMEGFMVWRWVDRWSEAFDQLVIWVKNNELKIKEHITVGFDKVFDAFLGMLTGENFGKSVVKV